MEKDLTYEIEKLLPEPVKVSLKKELTLTEDLDSEVDQAAAIFGFYAVLSERSDTRLQKVELAFENWEADEWMKKSRESETLKEKRLTNEQMKCHIRSLPKYMAYRMKIIELSEQKRVLKNIVKAFEIKASMVQTKCANRRREVTV